MHAAVATKVKSKCFRISFFRFLVVLALSCSVDVTLRLVPHCRLKKVLEEDMLKILCTAATRPICDFSMSCLLLNVTVMFFSKYLKLNSTLIWPLWIMIYYLDEYWILIVSPSRFFLNPKKIYLSINPCSYFWKISGYTSWRWNRQESAIFDWRTFCN